MSVLLVHFPLAPHPVRTGFSCYQSTGSASASSDVLVAGLGGLLSSWGTDLCLIHKRLFGSLTLSSGLPGPAVLSGSFPPPSVFLCCSSRTLNSFCKLIHSSNLFSGSSPNRPSRPDLPLLPPSPLLWLDPDWYSAIGRRYDL